MSSLSVWGRRVWKLTQLIENPQLIPLQRAGIGPETFLKFNRPWFHALHVDTIFDIGANSGQFAVALSHVLPKARIYSVEPLLGCFERLVKNSRKYPQIQPINCGVGAAGGTMRINENPYPDSSSFREMRSLHREQFPFTAGVEKFHDITMRTLDEIASDASIGHNVMVKMDVQGFEDEVIRGGMKTLSKARIVLIEVSFISLYVGSPSFDEINDSLKRLGLEFSGCVDQLIGPADGAILQGDALYLRRT